MIGATVGTAFGKPNGQSLDVIKRDGRSEQFSADKIERAVYRCLTNGVKMDPETANLVTNEAFVRVANIMSQWKGEVNVEKIQDLVEQQLMAMGQFEAAKNYILYREQHRKLRESRPIPQEILELVEHNRQYFKDPIQEFQFYDKYARFLDAEGRRETWEECIDRSITFMKKQVAKHLDREGLEKTKGLSTSEWDELRDAMIKMEALPSMRLLQMAGPATERCNVGIYSCSYVGLDSINAFSEMLYILMQGTGCGFSVESEYVDRLSKVRKQKRNQQVSTYPVPDNTEGWCEALIAGMQNWFSGQDIQFDFSQIRPQGAILKTKGGRASGPGPLKSLLEFTRKIILSKQGGHLSPLDCHDIATKIGDIVQVGGTRRAAEISLSDLDDEEMRHAKDGQFWLKHKHRQCANNSAVYEEKPSAIEFLREWTSLAESGSGERGIFNRGELYHQIPKRRKKDRFGVNPCLTADTWVMTSGGPKQIASLVSRRFYAVVDGVQANAPSEFWCTGEKEVFRVQTNRGFSVKATANHRFKTTDGWKAVSDLQIGDEILLHNHRHQLDSGGPDCFVWGDSGAQEGWLIGSLIGDGTFSVFHDRVTAQLCYWGDNAELLKDCAIQHIKSTVGSHVDLRGHFVESSDKWIVGSVPLAKFAVSLGIGPNTKTITPAMEEMPTAFCLGLLRGWFDADGSVQGSQSKGVSVRLTSIDLDGLLAAQRILARLGIISTVYRNRKEAGMKSLPDGNGGMRMYPVQALHELVISKNNLQPFAELVGFFDPEKSSTLRTLLGVYKRPPYKETFTTKVVSVELEGVEPVYDCTVPDVHQFDANGLVSHNCGEVVLRNREFCNLSIAVARGEDTPETLHRKVRLAAIFGTIQSLMTDFKFISPEWSKNCNEERLLGVDINGQMDCPLLRPNGSEESRIELLSALREVAVHTNQEFAARFGINPSAAVTCVKPSGNSSQLLGCSSGLHPRYARFFIRRVRAGAYSPVGRLLKEAGVPYHPELGESVNNPSTLVFEFPVKSPDSAVTRHDLSAMSQLSNWAVLKTHYTEHNPSITLQVKEEEWFEVGNWVYKNWEIVGGITFLPFNGGVYELAPYEEIDEEEYTRRELSFPKIDYSKLMRYESEDETTMHLDFACTNGACEI